MEDCGGVAIKFPPGGSKSDKVIVRGPKDDVEKAKTELLKLAKEKVRRVTHPVLLGWVTEYVCDVALHHSIGKKQYGHPTIQLVLLF